MSDIGSVSDDDAMDEMELTGPPTLAVSAPEIDMEDAPPLPPPSGPEPSTTSPFPPPGHDEDFDDEDEL